MHHPGQVPRFSAGYSKSWDASRDPGSDFLNALDPLFRGDDGKNTQIAHIV